MEVRTLTVLELAQRARAAVGQAFPHDVWVQGEIGSISRSSAGHVFFDLVDADGGGPPSASVGVVLFADVRRQVNEVLRASGAVRMTHGVQVRIQGRVEVFERSGRVQVRMTGIDPEHTLGRLAAARAEVVARLEADGVVGRNRALELAVLPRRVGIVTSVGSAAHADVLDELAASGLGFSVRVVHAEVQGVAAPERIAAAIAALDAHEVDVVLVVRGGGARTDLAAFDDERVGRAIVAAGVPVLTGIGHEIDRTVADIVAHTACKTPTACAGELVARTRQAVDRLDRAEALLVQRAPAATARSAERLDAAAGRLVRLGARQLAAGTAGLDRRARRLVSASDRATSAGERATQRGAATLAAVGRHHLRTAARHLDDGEAALVRRARRRLAGAEAHLEARGAIVAAADPARALARGWSVTRLPDGRLVRSTDQVAAGSALVTVLADGEVHSEVVSSRPDAGDGAVPDRGAR